MKAGFLILIALLVGRPAQGASCDWIVQTVAKQYQEFLEQAGVAPDPPLRKLFSLKRSQCQIPAQAAAIEKFGEALLDRHSDRIGVVLPLTGAHSELGLALKRGMLAWPGYSKKRVIFVDSKSQYRSTLEGLARLRLRARVGLWVVGGPGPTLDRVRDFADSLRMPTLLIANQKVSTARSRFALRVFPHQKEMARALAEAAAEKEWKRVGVLLRSGGRGQGFISEFAAHAKPLGVEIHQVANYQSGDFPSMNDAVKHLFQVDRDLRADEVKRIETAARSKAEAEDLPFDPRRVILPGRRELDAVLIPDNFRIVRHFARLFRYHKIFRMPLLGTSQWRNQGLVEPADGQLRGSLFVDFVGPYTELPPGLAPDVKAPFLPAPQAREIDAALMGYRTMALAHLPLPSQRRKIIEALKASAPPPDPFFGTNPSFSLEGGTHWPAFVFEVGTRRWKLKKVSGRHMGKRFLSSGSSPSKTPQSLPQPAPQNPSP